MSLRELVDLSEIPDTLRTIVERQIESLEENVPDHAYQSSPLWDELGRVWACSQFISHSCIANPDLLFELIESGDLDRDYEQHTLKEKLFARVSDVSDERQFSQILRQFRRREMVRIAWRDFANRAPLWMSLLDLSKLAEVCVQAASEFVQNGLEKLHGVPLSRDGERLELIVLGMGKLGAYELNYSSDIDLIYCYLEEGETSGGERRALSHSEFFVRLGQGLTRLLDEKNADGFVFRVDTRLRPFGNSGHLALSFDAMESYYERHGREWERYAMIKARVISGNPTQGEELMKRLKPFIYRRYIDFSAFESLREMKQLIVAEVKRKGMEDNIKLGSGGIREIEFIGQAFQLIRGGQEYRLQDRRIQRVLDVLGQMNILPTYVVEQLIAAYRFLRESENRIQAYDDQQTHNLPKDETGRLRLAYAMGFESWDSYKLTLDEFRNTVREHFSQIFSAPQADEQLAEDIDESTAAYVAIWAGSMDGDEAQRLLGEMGFEDAKHALNLINSLREGRAVRSLTQRARTRLDRLMPLLIAAVAGVGQKDEVLLRVIDLLEAIVRRSVYVALLIEHPVALSQLVRLFEMSPWIAQQLIRRPVLLDELLDPRRLYAPILKDDLQHELEIRMASVEEDDLEGQMDALRQYRHAHVLRVAASQLAEAVPLAKVSDHLTFIAEVLVKEVLKIALQQISKRHGKPTYVLNGETFEAGFAIIAYGKMGGWELGFGSDLDLVFLHDSQGEKQQTDGERCVDNATFFARLGQRIIHILSTQTSNGVLYEVDTRLRPSGQSGLLVSSLTSYADYQASQAWTWEHQALIRARFVAGSENIGKAFGDIRRETLCRQRNPEELAGEVQSMRVRMREALGSKDPSRFDIKQDIGGITDIEFIIQYMILRWAHEYPQLIEYPDNLRLIEGLAKIGKLSAEDAEFLTQSYLNYRNTVHKLVLAQAPSPTADEQSFHESREGVTRIWNAVLEPS